jgi:hypothetical protein
VDLQDVRALQLRGELHLVHQALGDVGVRGHARGQAVHADHLLEAGRSQLGGAVLGGERRALDLFEKDELAELLSLGHHGRRPIVFEAG